MEDKSIVREMTLRGSSMNKDSIGRRMLEDSHEGFLVAMEGHILEQSEIGVRLFRQRSEGMLLLLAPLESPGF